MEFGKEECAILRMKSGKRHTAEGIELPNQERIRILEEKKNNKYLGVLEADIIKQAKMKEKIRKEYLRRTRKLPIHTNICLFLQTKCSPLMIRDLYYIPYDVVQTP